MSREGVVRFMDTYLDLQVRGHCQLLIEHKSVMLKMFVTGNLLPSDTLRTLKFFRAPSSFGFAKLS